jgi:hypothetical protein
MSIEEIKNTVIKERRSIDLQNPVNGLLSTVVFDKKKSKSKEIYHRIKILRVNLSNNNEILYMIESEDGKRKYVFEKEIKII